MKLKEAGLLAKDTALEWWEDEAPRYSASLSFYTLLSLAPILLITVAIVGFFVGDAQDRIVDQAESLMGESGRGAVSTVLENADRPGQGVISLIVGVAVLIFGATGVFGQLQTAMNRMWEVERKGGQGIWGVIRQRFISFTAVLTTGFILLVSLVVSAGLAALGDVLRDAFPGASVILQMVNFVVSLAVISVLFALAFKILPDGEIRWRDVWPAALGTALLFVIGKSLIGLYLGQSSTSSSYGAAGSLVVLLIWVYYSAQIFFFGAEFAQVYANRYGEGIRLEEQAEAIPERPYSDSASP